MFESVEEAARLDPIMFVYVGVFSLVIFLVLGIVVGNVPTLRLLTRLGIPVLSGKILRDYKVANKLNRDVVGWVKVPEVCYAPIMVNSDGFYRKHDSRKSENNHGELYLADGKSSFDLRSIANKSDNSISDLSVIRGTAAVRSTSIRRAQFTCLKKYVITDLKKRNPDIFIVDNGKLRVFTLLFATEMGLEANKALRFTDRENFIGGMRELAYFDTGKPADKDVIILSGSTDIDTMLVFLVEKGV